LTALVSPV